MTAMTQPASDMLVPFIQSATHRVGQHRTDVDDIARILYEHGARTGLAMNAIEDAFIATFPPAPPIDTDAVRALESEMTAYGVSLPAFLHMWESPPAYEMALAFQERYFAIAGVSETDERQVAIEQAIARWWAEHEAEILTLCRAEAMRLLAER